MSAMAAPEVVVVGAGVSGLACARALAAAGRRVLVLERARGVGGRCATRRVGGHPLDMGPAFLHGSDPDFLAALEAVPGPRVAGWPARISGTGRPCQPDAFSPGERRMAFAEGVAAFPRHLAAGLEVRLETEVAALEATPGGVRLALAGGGTPLAAPAAVLALASEQAVGLLAGMPGAPPEVNAARAVLQMARSLPCLALLAVYPPGVPAPEWDVAYPERSPVLLMAANEAAKRGGPLALTLQASPAWSRERLRTSTWPEALLDEAAALLGPWAAQPEATHAHRWSYGRLERSAELAGPMLLPLPGGGRLGLCGDRFAPGGGVQAAFLSGQRLARRLLAAEATA